MDALLTTTDKEEALSRAYVSAVTAGAGYMISTMDFDRDGVDVGIRAGGRFRPSLDLQLKATINLKKSESGNLQFPLKIRNYDLLRIETISPRILVVMDLPRENSEWLNITPERLVLRRCAYWTSLRGFPESKNSETVTITLLDANRFDVEGLKSLMEQARTGAVS